MKKYLVFIAFVVITTKISAQTFNPCMLYKNNQTIIHSTGLAFRTTLSMYNTDTAVQHHIKFNFDKFDQKIPLASFIDSVKSNYQGKGFSLLEAMSLVYFSMRDKKIGDHPINRKGNFFIINDNGKIYILLFGWSNIQKKWTMAIVGEKEYTPTDEFIMNLFDISHSEIIYAAK